MGIKIGAVRLGSGTMTKMTNGEYVKEKVVVDKRMYLFFDEVQRVPSWEDVWK